MNEKSIVFLPGTAGQAAPWRKLSADGYVIGKGELASDFVGTASGEWVVVVPAEDIAVRWLVLPQGNTAQQVTAARWQMAEQLGHDLVDDEVVVGRKGPDGATPVAVVRRSLVSAWRSWAEDAGLNVVSVVPAQLCVPFDEGRLHAVPSLSGNIILSAKGLSVSAEPDLANDLIGDQQVDWTPADQALDVLAVGAISSPLNLISHTGSSNDWTVGRKTLAALALVFCLSPVWVGLADVAHNIWMQGQADKAAKAQAVAYFSDLSGQSDALEQAQRRLSLQPPLGSYTKALAALSGVVEAGSGTLTEVTGANGELRGVMRLGSPEDLARIRQEMLRYGVDFTDCEPVSENGQTVCAFVIGAA